MMNRCYRITDPKYYRYGARGIKVCERWHSASNFIADLEPHPGKGWSLDRIDNDRDYCPENCRWADSKTQRRNRPDVKLTPEAILAIRSRYIKGINQNVPGNGHILAAEFGVTKGLINEIANGRKWRNE